MVYFPSVSAVKASFDPNGSKAANYWINSSEDKTLTKSAEQELNKVVKAAAPAKKGIELYSPEFYAACTFGGSMACGVTHWAVTPLDLVKCRLQVSKGLYKSNMDGFKTIIAKDGLSGLYTGGGATLIGYSFQGAGKYGFYELFKKKYADIVGEETATKYKTSLYLVASASAEFIADILLCPWEAVKVKTQTTLPPFANGPFDGMKKIIAAEGANGLFKGLTPLWTRQIPYTMVKFATFENIVQFIYAQLPHKKEEYSLLAQTGVSFVGGYAAGIFCAAVSHPGDVMVSKINAERQAGESMGAAVSRIYARIGFGGLWNGLPVRIVMVGTLTGLQWLVYDSFKAYMGIPTAGGAKK